MNGARKELIDRAQGLGSSARQLGHLLKVTDWLMSEAPDPSEFEQARYEDVAAGLVAIARGLTADLMRRIDEMESAVTTAGVVPASEPTR